MSPSIPVAGGARRRPGRRILAAVAPVALVVALAGCGSGSSSTDDGAPPTDLGPVTDLTGKDAVEIEVGDNTFVPPLFKVSPGTKVTFRNVGNQGHDVTPASKGAFAGGGLRTGASLEVTAPTDPRSYRFYCSLHGTATSGQRGAMIVG